MFYMCCKDWICLKVLIIIFLSEPWPPGVVQHSVPLVIMMITPLRWGLRKMTMMNMMRERSPVPPMSCMLAPYKNNATTAGITEMGKYTGTRYYTILYYTSSPSIINCLINSCSLKVHREINGSPSPVDQGVTLVSSRRLKEVVPVEPSGKRTCDGRLICLSLRAMHQHTGRNRSHTSRNSSTSALPCAKPCYRINRSASVQN